MLLEDTRYYGVNNQLGIITGNVKDKAHQLS